MSHDAILFPSFHPFHVDSNSKVTLAPIQFPQALAAICCKLLLSQRVVWTDAHLPGSDYRVWLCQRTQIWQDFQRYLYVELLARWPQKHTVTFTASICCICASDLPVCVCMYVGGIMRVSSSVSEHFLLCACIGNCSDWFETLCVGSKSTGHTNSARHVKHVESIHSWHGRVWHSRTAANYASL